MTRVTAAVRTGPSTTELRDFPRPVLSADSGLLRVVAAGICGTDVKMYRNPPFDAPVIMGHENIGTIEEAGPEFLARNGLKLGDQVFVEHYVACYRCEWCRAGEYRHCELTDWRTNPNARRYGYTSSEHPFHLWGGFAQYMYLPWNAVIHKVPDGVSPELAGLLTPLANGVQWALRDGGVSFGKTVWIQGPGQQGLSQVVACKSAGASLIVVSGTERDAARLELARRLGADHLIDVTAEDPVERIRAITDGVGVDVMLDCTAGAGVGPVLAGIRALKRRGGTMVVQGEMARFPDFPLKALTEAAVTLRSARGHSFASCEAALDILASHRFPLEDLATHRFGLAETGEAIEAVGGAIGEDVVHVTLDPWLSA